MRLFQLIEMYGFRPGEFKLVRHGYKELNPLEEFRNNPKSLDSYQSFQREKGSKNFSGAKYIAVFSPYHGTQAIFLGVWKVGAHVPAVNAPKFKLKEAKKYGWDLNASICYDLQKVEQFDDLSERLIIEWGGSTVTWIQKKDKEVVSILPVSQIREFKSYENTILDWHELLRLVKNPTGNFTWVNALKAVNGIYCIVNMKNGRCYVGSAYGKNGIWGRWSTYSKNKHGGNEQLIELINKSPKIFQHFQFSILEILPGSSTADDAINKENLWKKKLGTRLGGYNSN